ncbi:hypothetical protein DXG01_012710 [Tephrocybe rancida]|nr:hypothetical protein DXG01_012710 [Tephrocybe rancida]
MAPQDDPEQKEERQRGAKGQTPSGGEPQAPSKRPRAATSTRCKAETMQAACMAPSNANGHPKQPNTGAPGATRYATPAPPPATHPNGRTDDDNVRVDEFLLRLRAHLYARQWTRIKHGKDSSQRRLYTVHNSFRT